MEPSNFNPVPIAVAVMLISALVICLLQRSADRKAQKQWLSPEKLGIESLGEQFKVLQVDLVNKKVLLQHGLFNWGEFPIYQKYWYETTNIPVEILNVNINFELIQKEGVLYFQKIARVIHPNDDMAKIHTFKKGVPLKEVS